MKKILVFLFVFCLVVAFALPCFAYDQYTYDFRDTEAVDGAFLLSGFDFPTSGNFVVKVSLFANQTFYTSVSASTVVPTIDGDFLAYQLPVTCSFDIDGVELVLVGALVFIPEDYGEDGDFILSRGVYFAIENLGVNDGHLDFVVTLERIVNPDFVESTNFGLGSIISWIGSLITSFTSGPLYPLMVLMMLGITVTVLLLCYRVIKKITWG